jgi:DNA-binding NtrC family response regulator
VLSLAANGQLKSAAAPIATDGSLPMQVAALETQLIQAALTASGGNQSQAARALGISRLGLTKKMSRLGLRPAD